jgi:hypothetical protein
VRRQLRTTALLGAVAFALGLLLRRRALHGFDAFLALQATQDSGPGLPGSLFYVPLARAAWTLLRPVVPDAFAAMGVLSALGTAVAAAAAHRAALALRLRQPVATALLLLVLPAVVYFGATVEVDPLMLGMGGVAWWCAVPFVRRPRPRRAMALGAVTGVAACLHGGGQLLLLAIAALALARAGQRAWRRANRAPIVRVLRDGALAALVHAALYAVSSVVCGREGQGAMAASVALLSPCWARLPTTLFYEWLLPYAPVAVLWPLAARRRPLRWIVAAFAVVWVAYLMLTNAVMGYFEPGPAELWEHGAFFVTVAAPTVLLCGAALPRAAQRAAIVASAAIAVGMARYGDWAPMPAGFAADVRQLGAAESPYIVCADVEHEYGWIRKADGSIPGMYLGEIDRLIRLYERAGNAIDADRVAAWFDERVEFVAKQGHGVILTGRALDALRAHADARLRALAEYLPRHYALEPFRIGSFDGVRLRRR